MNKITSKIDQKFVLHRNNDCIYLKHHSQIDKFDFETRKTLKQNKVLSELKKTRLYIYV